MRIHREAAVERELIGTGQGIPEILDPDRATGVPGSPQPVRDLAVDANASAGELEARQNGRHRVPKRCPFRQVSTNPWCRDFAGIQDGQLSRIAQRLWAES